MSQAPIALLACPLTRLPVKEVPLAEARAAISAGRPLRCRTSGKTPVGETPTVLLRQDNLAAYPIVDGYPIMLGPEVLMAVAPEFDLANSHYAEAYLETEFYDAEAAASADAIRAGSLTSSQSEGIRWLARLRDISPAERRDFPYPITRWLVDRMDLGANWDCYAHIGSVVDQRVLQVGGTGHGVLALLLAGASDGWLVTPMLGEAKLATALADALGVEVRCVVGIGEELPLKESSFDVVYSAGCVHHMTTPMAFPEMARVLREGGRFAAIEPWRAPLYAIGSRAFGKREANAFCRPLTRQRVEPLFSAFSSAQAVQHGAIARYPMLALERLGARFPLELAWRIGRIDDALSSMIGLRRFGSGVALLGSK